MRACITTAICKQTQSFTSLRFKGWASSLSQHMFISHHHSASTKAETNTHTHLTLYALILTHVKPSSPPFHTHTHPFVHSQGIFQWAKPDTGYTAAGTSAQCMSIKLLSFSFCLFFCFLISYFPKLWLKTPVTKWKGKKVRIFVSWGERHECSPGARWLFIYNVNVFIFPLTLD